MFHGHWPYPAQRLARSVQCAWSCATVCSPNVFSSIIVEYGCSRGYSAFSSPLRPALPDSVRQSSGKANRKRTSERLVLCVHGAGLLCSEFENPEQLHRTVDGRLISGVICTWIAGIWAATRILGDPFEAIGYIRLANFLEHQAEGKIPDRIV